MKTCTVNMILNLLYDYVPRKPVLLLRDEVITDYQVCDGSMRQLCETPQTI